LIAAHLLIWPKYGDNTYYLRIGKAKKEHLHVKLYSGVLLQGTILSLITTFPPEKT
jgi:hypothetical protein